MSKKQSIIFIILIYSVIVILLFSFLVFLYKNSDANKFNKFDKIVELSNDIDYEVDFYNIDIDEIGVNFYKLKDSKNKVGQNTIHKEYQKSKIISFELFEKFLENISKITHTNYIIPENRILTYGGEKIIVSSEQLAELLNYLN